MGLGSLLNSNCGCVITTGVDWDPLTIAVVRALEKKIGQSSEIGDALNSIVLLARTGSGTTPVVAGTRTRYFVFQVGNAPMVAPSVEITGTAFNGKVFTFPELENAKLATVHVGRTYDVPEPDGYNFDPTNYTLEFANDIFNVNLYITAIFDEGNVPANSGGSIVLTVPADGVDSVTSSLLVGKVITAYTHGNVTSNDGFTKPESSDTFTLTDGNLLYTDAPLTLFY